MQRLHSEKRSYPVVHKPIGSDKECAAYNSSRSPGVSVYAIDHHEWYGSNEFRDEYPERNGVYL